MNFAKNHSNFFVFDLLATSEREITTFFQGYLVVSSDQLSIYLTTFVFYATISRKLSR